MGLGFGGGRERVREAFIAADTGTQGNYDVVDKREMDRAYLVCGKGQEKRLIWVKECCTFSVSR